MKKHFYTKVWRSIMSSLFTLGVVFSSHAANEITVYKHCNYDASGYAVSLSVGTYSTAQLSALGIVNNDISSIRVTNGFEILLYDSDNLTGTSVTARADVSCLTAQSFNDRASSVRVRAIPATVYKHCNYDATGYAVLLPVGDYTTAQLTALGVANNDISSLKVIAGYEVLLYDSDNFTGASVTVNANNTCLVAQSFNDRASSVRVRAAVNNQAPSVAITAPANNATFTVPTSVTITASASDADGTITKVEFYNGTTLIGTSTSAPYSYNWTSVQVGSYQLTAKATDNAGAATTSSVVNITVNPGTIIVDLTDLPGTTTAQYTDSPTNEGIARLTDNSATSKYLTFHNAGWVQFQRSATSIVTSYTLTSANDAPERDPLNWTFQGSLDGNSWTTIDARNGEDFPTRALKKTFSFSNTTAYNYFRLQLTNNSGSILQIAEWEIFGTVPYTGDDWANFRYPEINFQNTAPTHPGSTVFNTAMPDPVGDMRAQILLLAKKIYYNDHDNILSFNKLNFYLEDFDGVAYKSGSPPEITIVVSVRHIQNVYNNAGGDYNAIRTEILGILSHEGTHGYQYEPRNAGSYTPGTDFYGFIEGLADYTRIAVGLHPGRVASTGGSWTSGYTTSGFFINWLVKYKDPEFAIKFNHTARTYSTWSWDLACQGILGVGVQALWDEYQAWLRAGGSFRLAQQDAYPLEQTTCSYTQKSSVANVTLEYNIYYNATDESLYVSSETTEASHVMIYNMQGLLLKEAYVSGTGNFNAADLPQGICIVRIESASGGSYQDKVMIRR